MPLLPKASHADPIISGHFVASQGWIWWVWTFLHGWQEWVPAWLMCGYFTGIGLDDAWQSFGDQNRAQVMMFRALHEHLLGFPAPEIDSPELYHLIYGHNGQLQWMMRANHSEWYYDTISEYSAWDALCLHVFAKIECSIENFVFTLCIVHDPQQCEASNAETKC